MLHRVQVAQVELDARPVWVTREPQERISALAASASPAAFDKQNLISHEGSDNCQVHHTNRTFKVNNYLAYFSTVMQLANIGKCAERITSIKFTIAARVHE